MYKFREITQNNNENYAYAEKKTQFQAEFTSYLNVATAIPNLAFLILNTGYGHLWVSTSFLFYLLCVVIYHWSYYLISDHEIQCGQGKFWETSNLYIIR